MKVLIIGGGGREHALAWKLTQEHPGLEIVAAPGNPGLAQLGRCVRVAPTDVDALVALAERERPEFTLVGPEAPLSAGLVDRFRARGLPVFGPTQAAARIETSKTFAKQLMLDAGIPTARAERHTDVEEAKRAVRAFGVPVVVKAAGLAAGKGVVVADTIDEADRAIEFMLRDEGLGEAGAELLVEEFMEGEELSCFFVTDGTTAVPLVPAQDHKRLLDGDRGPNTGGMGAYAPVTVSDRGAPALAARGVGRRLLDGVLGGASHLPPTVGGTPAAVPAWADLLGVVQGRIVRPTLAALRERGTPFTGLLYAGLMLTRDGPRVVEFNCRFGDPETQAVLPLSDGVLPLLRAVALGERLPTGAAWPATAGRAAVTTVLAAAGYPDRPRTGDPIILPGALPPDVHLFHAGTALDAEGRLVTAGGRVLAVTAVADRFDRARTLSREWAERVEFAGRQLRTDIGWRESAREPRG